MKKPKTPVFPEHNDKYHDKLVLEIIKEMSSSSNSINSIENDNNIKKQVF